MIGSVENILPDLNADYTDSQFVEEIRQKTQAILRQQFPSSLQKQQIRTDQSGLVVACPYCHDSATVEYKKRGHLLLSGKWSGYYKCFNCGTFVTIPRFMSDFQETLSLSGIKYVQSHRNEIQSFNSSSGELTANIFQKDKALEWSLSRDYLKAQLGLVEITTAYRSVTAYNYLMGRSQTDFRKFLFDPKTNYIYILNLVDDKIIGYQMRSINPYTPKDKRYLTYNLSRIYSDVIKTTTKVPQDLDALSVTFGIFSCDLTRTMIMLEGPLDSFLIPNGIAMAGASKTLNVELPFWYLYDSDKTGNQHTLEKLQQRKKVFLWGKLKKDYNLPKRSKWDVNDLVTYCQQNNLRLPNWLNYFSDNPLDVIYIDRISGLGKLF